MAAGGPMKDLCNEAVCPICLEYFADPITLNCGHNFCLACITQCRLELNSETCCPQCRGTVQQWNFKPNKQLANVVKLIKQLNDPLTKEAAGSERVCERHREPLKLFCEEHDSPICVVCDKSSEHRDHKVIPLEEAFQNYKEKIQFEQQSLEQEREKHEAWKLIETLSIPDCLTQLEVEKQKILSSLDQMHTFFYERQQLAVAQLSNFKNEIERIQKESVKKLSDNISHLNNLITEIQEKCQQPPSEFLQDIKSNLNRYKKKHVTKPDDLFPSLEKKLLNFSQTTAVLVTKLLRKQTEALEMFKGRPPTSKDPEHLWNEALEQALNKVDVTLDQNTASPYLKLSTDLRNVQWGYKWQKLPVNPKRFDFVPCVLGHEGFTSGRHWWEVKVEKLNEGERGSWALGVASESVKRKDLNEISPNEGIWAVGKKVSVGLFAFTSSKRTNLILNGEHRKIQVSLDYEGGQVKFLNTDTDEVIFIFHSVSFSGKKIFPFFWVGRGFKLYC